MLPRKPKRAKKAITPIKYQGPRASVQSSARPKGKAKRQGAVKRKRM